MTRVCITGMHRSGTSLVARLCNLLGVELGPERQLVGAEAENPKGFFESRPLLEVNKRLLARLGGDWQHPPMLPRGWESDAALAELREEASAALDGLDPAGEASLVGFKDPRSSLTLPFWAHLGAADRVVLGVRDPLEVAASLQARNDLPVEQGLALWNRYLVAALAHAPDAHVVLHHEIFDHPDRVVADLAAALGLPTDPDRVRAARDAIEPELRRSDPAPPPDQGSARLARWLFAGLCDGRRPDPVVLTALDDAHNGRHLPTEDGEVPQVVTSSTLRGLSQDLQDERDEARRARKRARRAEAARTQEAERVAELEERLEAVYTSSTWRAGRLLVGLPAAIRRRLRP